MKAVVITEPGGFDVLELRDVATPGPAVANQVLVRVRASALNRADVLQRKGLYPPPPGAPKDIPGMEFAGEVEQVGTDVRSLSVGQRVFGITAGGAHSQYVVVPENHLVEIPSNLDWVSAAAVPEVFITAHDAMFTQARLAPGETMLVHAAGSGVGTAASQLAIVAGARAFGTSRTAEKLERAREFGLSESVVVKNDPGAIVETVKDWTKGKGVNVIIDLVGGAYLEANLKSLAYKGRLIFVGTTAGAQATLSYGLVMSKRLLLRGTVLRGRSNEEKATATRLFGEQVVPLLARGLVRPVIDRVYKLDEVRAAHERMESDQNFGKVVLEID